MLAFLGGLSAVATSLVFMGGAVAGQSLQLGLVLAGLGGGWLGILYGSLIRLASTTRQHDS
jgi:hypothetical protein